MPRRILIGLVLMLLLPSCAGEAQERREPTGAQQAVANCKFQHWIGKPVNETPVRTLGRPYRILPPNSAMTMDHIPNRINVFTDDRGMVIKVRCG